MVFESSWLSRFSERLKREISDAEIEFVSLGDINGDGKLDFSLSLTEVTEYTYQSWFGREFSWELKSDRDFVVLSRDDGSNTRNLNRFTSIEGPVVDTVALGDINGDGLDDFASLTGAGSYYGYYGNASGYYGNDALDPRGFFADAIDEVYITLGGARQQANTVGEIFGIDGNVVAIKALGDVNGDGIDDVSVSTGAFYGNFSDMAYYGREIDQTFLVLGGDGPTAPINIGRLTPGSTVLGVDVLGDINDDGFVDLAATIGGFYGAGESEGYYGEVREDVLVVLGGEEGLALGESLTELVDQPGTRALKAEGIDINGDGIADLAVQVGGYYGYYGTPDPGEAGYYGREVTDVLVFLANDVDAAPINLGRFAGDGRTAREIYDLGDINGDGLSDIGVGVVGYYGYYGNTGAYYGYYGFEIEDVLVILGNESGAVRPINLNDFVGIDADLRGALDLGDINGDGFNDFGVANYYGVNGFNESLIVLGGDTSARGTFELRDLGLDESLFSNITALGDANGDGFADFSIQGYYGYYGAAYYGEDALGLSAYVVFGGEMEVSVGAFAQNVRRADGDTIAVLDLDLDPLDVPIVSVLEDIIT